MSGVPATLSPATGHVREPGRIFRSSRRAVRDAVRVLNLEERKEVKEERKAWPEDGCVQMIAATQSSVSVFTMIRGAE